MGMIFILTLIFEIQQACKINSSKKKACKILLNMCVIVVKSCCKFKEKDKKIVS